VALVLIRHAAERVRRLQSSLRRVCRVASSLHTAVLACYNNTCWLSSSRHPSPSQGRRGILSSRSTIYTFAVRAAHRTGATWRQRRTTARQAPRCPTPCRRCLCHLLPPASACAHQLSRPLSTARAPAGVGEGEGRTVAPGRRCARRQWLFLRHVALAADPLCTIWRHFFERGRGWEAGRRTAVGARLPLSNHAARGIIPLLLAASSLVAASAHAGMPSFMNIKTTAGLYARRACGCLEGRHGCFLCTCLLPSTAPYLLLRCSPHYLRSLPTCSLPADALIGRWHGTKKRHGAAGVCSDGRAGPLLAACTTGGHAAIPACVGAAGGLFRAARCGTVTPLKRGAERNALPSGRTNISNVPSGGAGRLG